MKNIRKHKLFEHPKKSEEEKTQKSSRTGVIPCEKSKYCHLKSNETKYWGILLFSVIYHLHWKMLWDETMGRAGWEKIIYIMFRRSPLPTDLLRIEIQEFRQLPQQPQGCPPIGPAPAAGCSYWSENWRGRPDWTKEGTRPAKWGARRNRRGCENDFLWKIKRKKTKHTD